MILIQHYTEEMKDYLEGIRQYVGIGVSVHMDGLLLNVADVLPILLQKKLASRKMTKLSRLMMRMLQQSGKQI